MDVKSSLKSQYHAAFAMLRQTIELCPPEVWISGKHPRPYWRIAYHAIHYTHMYLEQTEFDFIPWELHRDDNANVYRATRGMSKNPTPYTQEELLSYCDQSNAKVDEAVDLLDLEAKDCGFSWYKMSKFEHQLVNLRHLQQHAGQLSEILMMHKVDTQWFGGSRKNL